MCFLGGTKTGIRGGRNAVALHECLGKILGGFQLSGLPRRAKDFQAVGAKCVHDAVG